MDRSEGAGTANARNYGATSPATISADTFTGQIAFLDEVIHHARDILSRATKQADTLLPSQDPTPELNKVSRIDGPPDAGPLLYRLQNRAQELNTLMGMIGRQQSRIDQVL